MTVRRVKRREDKVTSCRHYRQKRVDTACVTGRSATTLPRRLPSPARGLQSGAQWDVYYQTAAKRKHNHGSRQLNASRMSLSGHIVGAENVPWSMAWIDQDVVTNLISPASKVLRIKIDRPTLFRRAEMLQQANALDERGFSNAATWLTRVIAATLRAIQPAGTSAAVVARSADY